MNYPKKVTIGDITVRDGFQHEEKFIPTEAKLWVAEQLILSGFKHIELTNLGNPKGMPQFKDSDEILKSLRNSKTVAHLINGVSLTAVTIREKAIERAIQARKEGWFIAGRLLEDGRKIHSVGTRCRIKGEWNSKYHLGLPD